MSFLPGVESRLRPNSWQPTPQGRCAYLGGRRNLLRPAERLFVQVRHRHDWIRWLFHFRAMNRLFHHREVNRKRLMEVNHDGCETPRRDVRPQSRLDGK